MTSEKQALIAFGANLPFGDLSPKEVILLASGQLAAATGGKVLLSALYKTPCFPAGAGPDYVNAAAKLTSRHSIDAMQLLKILHEIEARFGRERLTRWGQRSLDLDLLAMGDQVWPNPATQGDWRCLSLEDQARLAPTELILPHPRLQDRSFVLVPLADVAEDWRHPILDQTVAEMLAALPAGDRDNVVRLDLAASD